MESFGEYIKRLRNEKGLNQTELAVQVKLDGGGMSKVENDKKPLNEERLILLAKALGVDEKQLKKQYLSDQFAKKTLEYKVSDNVFQLAEQKTKYYNSINVKQGKFAI